MHHGTLLREREKEALTTENNGRECVTVSENNNNKALTTSTKIRLTTTITKN